MRTLRVAVAALVTVAVTAPAAQAEFRTRTEWPGGIRFGGEMTGLAIDPSGRTLAARERNFDQRAQRFRNDVFRYSPSGHQTGRIRNVGAGQTIAIDAADRIFTAAPSGAVTRWGTTGKREARFATGG